MIWLPPTLQSIGYRAFESCTELTRVFFCGNTDGIVNDKDPFPSNPTVYAFYDYPSDKFCGYECLRVLDYDCNIPTNHFTIMANAVYTRSAMYISVDCLFPPFVINFLWCTLK